MELCFSLKSIVLFIALFIEKHCAFHGVALFTEKHCAFHEKCCTFHGVVLSLKSIALFTEKCALFMKSTALFIKLRFSLKSTVLFTEKQQKHLIQHRSLIMTWCFIEYRGKANWVYLTFWWYLVVHVCVYGA